MSARCSASRAEFRWRCNSIHLKMTVQYLFFFAQAHHEFRIPELLSLSKMFGFDLNLPENPEDQDPTRPFLIVGLQCEEHARLLASRSILIKCVAFCFVTPVLILLPDRSTNIMVTDRRMKISISAIVAIATNGPNTYQTRPSSFLSRHTIIKYLSHDKEKLLKALPIWVS